MVLEGAFSGQSGGARGGVVEIAASGRGAGFSAESRSSRTRGAVADQAGSSREQDRGEVPQRAELGSVTPLHVFSCIFRSRMFSVWWQR